MNMRSRNVHSRSQGRFSTRAALRSTVVGAAVLFAAAGLQAQVWQAQGPAAIDGGPDLIFGIEIVETASENNNAVGAVHAAAPHPYLSNVLYVGSVNGGVWVTYNAKSKNPFWIPLTDSQASQSITALEFDPTDPWNSTLVAGTGDFSSFGFAARATGLLRTENGGFSWQAIDGGGTLLDKRITGVAARGDTLVASVDLAQPFTFANVGVFRSTDGGATFNQIAFGDGSATGLPGGLCDDLVGDPNNPDRLYTSVIFADLIGGQNGVYRSDDAGATWTKVSDPVIDSLLISGATSNVEFAVGQDGNVFVGIVNFVPGFGSRLAGVFRSGDGGDTWTSLGLPFTVEDGFAIGTHPGGQGALHMSIAADPNDPNVVYVGGDRQPFFTEASGDATKPGFPNSIGADAFSGRIFRGDAAAASIWTPATHVGTASGSAPHADSREMVFDASGDLIQTDDGGVYRLTDPATGNGDWFTVNGNLQVSEFHATEYDDNNRIIFGGTQDNGSPYQSKRNRRAWNITQGGDGADVQVDTTSDPGFSLRYGSSQFLGAFNLTVWDDSNQFVGGLLPALTPLGGAAPIQAQFYTPVELNAVDPLRLIIGAGNGVYESLDQGDTVSLVAADVAANGFGSSPIGYGAADNPDILYVGAADNVLVRTAAGSPLAVSATFPGAGTGFFVRDIAVDPADGDRAFVVTSVAVFLTEDAGATWVDITGDLTASSAFPFLSVAFVPAPFGFDQDRVAVGTVDGVYGAAAQDGFAAWDRAGIDVDPIRIPNVPVFDLDYVPGERLIVAGTLGRGTWKLKVVPFIGFVGQPADAVDGVVAE